MAVETETKTLPKLTLTTPQARPKLTVKIPLFPLLSSSNPTALTSNLRTNQLTSIPSITSFSIPPAPTTASPPSDIYPLIPKLHPCLQCHIRGLKCSFITSFHILPPRVRLHAWHAVPDSRSCVRCRRNGEAFCIMREMVDGGMGVEVEVEYTAYGVKEEILEEKIEGMLEERSKVARWALPESSGEHIESVNPGRWQWKRAWEK